MKAQSLAKPLLAWTVVLIGAIACVDGVTDPSSTQLRLLATGSQSQLDSAVQGRLDRGIEDDILRLEARHPGLGGVAVDSSGALVVFLRSPADVETLRSEILSELARRLGPSELRDSLAAGMRIRTLPASFSFSELVDGANRASRLVQQHPSVVSVDADEARNRVTIGVTHETAVEAVTAYFVAGGLDPGILNVKVVGIPRTLGSVRNYWRPTGGGLQFVRATNNWCTIGWNVTNYLADSGFVTAGHCAPGEIGTGQTGPVYQPTTSNAQFGVIELNPEWNVVDDRCNGYAKCAKADAMYVRYTDHSAWNARVAKTASVGTNYAGGSISVTGWWTSIPYVAGEYVGQPLEKIGRTTGWTAGTMSESCVNWSVPGSHTIICAHRVTGSRVGTGDSGSPVFRRISNSLYPVGILFGGEGAGLWELVDGELLCRQAGCSYLFSNWNYATVTHLGRQFDPTN